MAGRASYAVGVLTAAGLLAIVYGPIALSVIGPIAITYKATLTAVA